MEVKSEALALKKSQQHTPTGLLKMASVWRAEQEEPLAGPGGQTPLGVWGSGGVPEGVRKGCDMISLYFLKIILIKT